MFKFPDAVLVSRGGMGYGEVPFRLDPQTPQYVRMDNRIIKHLFGEFTPSAGDLVCVTGESIGIMVNSDADRAVIDKFLPARRSRPARTHSPSIPSAAGGPEIAPAPPARPAAVARHPVRTNVIH